MAKTPVLIQRSYRIRVYPNADQRAMLNRWFGTARWAWNHALERRNKAYRRRGESVTGTDASRAITALKKTRRYAWLSAVPSGVIVQKLRDQDRAFTNFFAGRAKYPRVRKRMAAQSVRVQIDQRQNRVIARWSGGEVFVPGLGAMRWRNAAHPEQAPKMVTIRRDAAGRYFVTVMVEEPPAARPAAKNESVGIDLGLKSLAVLSTGEVIRNPRHLRSKERRLRRRQRALSRKRRGSGRWHRARRQVAHLHAQVADTRRDHLHKLTRRLVDENQVLAVEDLSVKGLARTRLAKSVNDAGWGEFRRQLDYKAQWAGRELVVIDRFAPSTRQCSGCGHVRGAVPLNVRQWQCSECGAEHDRDINAAKNIERLALDQLPGGTGEVKRVESGRSLGGKMPTHPPVPALNEARTGQPATG